MCGIAGFCDFKLRSSETVLRSVTQSLSHRGPDDEGFYFQNNETCQIGLGHRRLSIIDVSSLGHQPMISECGNFIIVFNGEIYNYQELKNELTISDGIQFRTQSDTEVLLQLYKKSPANFLDKLRGMFAFVILDKKEKKLVAVRDRVGVKPFYYHYADGLFLFGSELKAIVAHPAFNKQINIDALSDYFRYGYIGEEKTIYKDTHKLEKGTRLELNLETRELKKSEYWNIADYFKKPKLTTSYASIEEELIHQFKEAFKYRLVSDVPVGVFLSGGYDSALVTSILTRELNQKLTTFTVGFEEKEFDESEDARKVASILGTKHETLMCSESDAAKWVDQLPFIYDEPFSDPSAIPTLLVSNRAASKVKVILSADGGDENFCGYNRYKNYYNRINTFNEPGSVRKAIGEKVGPYLPEAAQSWVDIFSGDVSSYLSKVNSHMTDADLAKILPGATQKISDSKTDNIAAGDHMLLWDMKHYLPDDVLVKVDRASMAFGLESREPILDHRLMEYAAQIPFDYKLHKGTLKYPIKNIVHRYIDKELMDRPKKGFSPPLEKWMTTLFKQEFNDITSESSLKNQGIFNVKHFAESINKVKPDYLRFRLMWSAFVFQKWYKTWIKP